MSKKSKKETQHYATDCMGERFTVGDTVCWPIVAYGTIVMVVGEVTNIEDYMTAYFNTRIVDKVVISDVNYGRRWTRCLDRVVLVRRKKD